MRPALCYSICVMRSCVVASCPFNVELPARILHNTLSLPLASTVLSMNVHNKQVDTLCCHWTGSGNPVWNLRHQLMKIHTQYCREQVINQERLRKRLKYQTGRSFSHHDMPIIATLQCAAQMSLTQGCTVGAVHQCGRLALPRGSQRATRLTRM